MTTPVAINEVFAPEVFDGHQRMMADTARAFVHGEVRPLAERIAMPEPGLMRSLLHKAGTLGLLSADIPEECGGLAAGLTVSAILADYLAGDASFGVAWGVHTTVGTLPIVYHGTPEQKARWLPGMATGALVGAYALTEPAPGSDAMGIKTRATRDGDSYVLNGQKQWISNAGFADVMVTFAKVDETRHTVLHRALCHPRHRAGRRGEEDGHQGLVHARGLLRQRARPGAQRAGRGRPSGDISSSACSTTSGWAPGFGIASSSMVRISGALGSRGAVRLAWC